MRGLIAALLLLSPLRLFAQEAQEEGWATAVVPVVGAVTGIGGVRWTTDVELRNPTGNDLTVIVTALTLGGDDRPLIFTMSPGQTMLLPNVVHEAFGSDSTLSPLLVRTEGRRSVVVNCVIHGVSSERTVSPQSETPLYSEILASHDTISPLTQDEKYRTNIGLGNIGDETATMTLGLQRISGRNLATATVKLPPQSLMQVSLASLFPVVTKGSDLVLVSDSSSLKTYVYASVLRNETHDGVFRSP